MEEFAVAYSVVWLALALYVARLGNRQRQLTRTMQDMQKRIHNHPRWTESRASEAA